MRISGINNVNSIYSASKAKKAYGAGNQVQSSDSLAISDFARELSIANKAVNGSADIRTDKVSEIKTQMEAGEYNVTADDLATKLVGDYFA